MIKSSKGNATGHLQTMENPREQTTWFHQEKTAKEGEEIKGNYN